MCRAVTQVGQNAQGAETKMETGGGAAMGLGCGYDHMLMYEGTEKRRHNDGLQEGKQEPCVGLSFGNHNRLMIFNTHFYICVCV